MLQRGSKGEAVKILQRKLGVTSDGDFGPETEKAVKEYQKYYNLQVDGIAGPQTLTHMVTVDILPFKWVRSLWNKLKL